MDHDLQISSKSKCTDSINLSTSPIAICHEDLARRNLRITSNGTLYILDWAYASVYPIVLEYFALGYLICHKDENIFTFT